MFVKIFHFAASRYTVVVFFLWFYPSVLSSVAQNNRYQVGEELIIKGDIYFYKYMFRGALSYYTSAMKIEPENPEIHLKLAETYYQLKNMEKAGKWYDLIVKNHEEMMQAVNYLNFSHVLILKGEFSEAEKWTHRYNAKVAKASRGEGIDIESILNTVQYYKDTTLVEIQNMNFNTENSEVAPLIVGDRVVFSSTGFSQNKNKTETGFYDIYSTTKNEEGIFSPPEKLGEGINTKYHDGPIHFFNNNSEFIVTSNSTKQFESSKDKNQEHTLSLFHGKIDSDFNLEQDQDEVLFIDFNMPNAAHPTLSIDGQTMYFVSNSSLTSEGTNLYVSKKRNGAWQKPNPLASGINTAGNEMFPILYNDSLLYFASNGQGGLGGMDIFYVDLFDPEQAVVNAGAPINSEFDDLSIFIGQGGKSGYFSSDRAEGKGQDDIYYFTKYDVSIPDTTQVVQEETIKDHELSNKLRGTLTFTLYNDFEVNLKLGNNINYQFKLDELKPSDIIEDKLISSVAFRASKEHAFSLYGALLEVNSSIDSQPRIENHTLKNGSGYSITLIPISDPMTDQDTLEERSVLTIDGKEYNLQKDTVKLFFIHASSAMTDMTTISTTEEPNVKFIVQIGAYRNRVSPEKLKELFPGINNIVEIEQDGLYKYSFGGFTSLFKAYEAKNDCAVDGAFITVSDQVSN